MVAAREIIQIDGKKVSVVETRELYTTDISNVFPLERRLPVTLPTLPRTMVFAHWDETSPPTKTIYLLAELPPGVRNIRKRDRRYRLGMPWTYFWFVASNTRDLNGRRWSLDHWRIFHAHDRYENEKSTMISARCPNVYSDGRICWGATGASVDLPLCDRVDELVMNWYVSRFNGDLDGSVPLPNGAANYKEWVTETAKDPFWWKTWSDWTSDRVRKYTVENLLVDHAAHNGVFEEIMLPNVIPPVNLENQFTFGHWEEWYRRIPAPQLSRALQALENMRTDNPALFDISNATVTTPVIDPNDDGGVPIDDSERAAIGRSGY